VGTASVTAAADVVTEKMISTASSCRELGLALGDRDGALGLALGEAVGEADGRVLVLA